MISAVRVYGYVSVYEDRYNNYLGVCTVRVGMSLIVILLTFIVVVTFCLFWLFIALVNYYRC